ncbi:hypothetical protein HDV00_010129 [Rhizophlyctis rosea]|nr:hypothetical protein HDV00_010129 [Rhizophlyctis rosea]
MLQDYPAVATGGSTTLVNDFLMDVLGDGGALPRRIIETMERTAALIQATESGSGLGTLWPQLQAAMGDQKGREFVQIHIRNLKIEQSQLGLLYFLIAARFKLTVDETLQLLKKLCGVGGGLDGTALHLVASALVNFHVDPADTGLGRFGVGLNSGSVQNIQKIIRNETWQLSDSLRNVVWLQWVRFLRIGSMPPGIKDVTNKPDYLVKSWSSEAGVKPGVYDFARDELLGFLDTTRAPTATRQANGNTDGTQAGLPDEPELDGAVREYLVLLVEDLVDEVVGQCRRAMRESKQILEGAIGDLEAGVAHPNRQQLPDNLQQQLNNRHTFWEALLSLISVLYADRPDAARIFWTDNEHINFVASAADSFAPLYIKAFLDMLSSIATGPECSQHAHLSLNDNNQRNLFGNITWRLLFDIINGHCDDFSQAGKDLTIKEQSLIISFLKVLQQVAKYSPSARRALCDDQYLRALHSLFRMLVQRVSIELKAAMLNCIASFAAPGSNDIQQQIWLLIESAGIVPMNRFGVGQGRQMFYGPEAGSHQNDGIVYDLENSEAQTQTYPETMAFLNLLNVLLQPNKNSPVGLLSETLGKQEGRTPGLRPYVRYVIEVVFQKIKDRGFQSEVERWRMYDLCLSIMESCLEQLNIQSLAGPDGQIALTPQTLQAASVLGLHPGFEVLCRILTGGMLKDELFRIIDQNAESIIGEQKVLPTIPKTILSTLRILKRALDVQRSFLQIVAPAILESGNNVVLDLPSIMTGVDHFFAERAGSTVVRVALLINCHSFEEADAICWYAVKILATLSQSPELGTYGDGGSAVNLLVSVLEGSDESRMIIGGFRERLELDEDEPVLEPYSQSDVRDDGRLMGVEEDAEPTVTVDRDGAPAGMQHAVRVAILDLLLDNLRSQRTPPNLAHFLLGYNVKRPLQHTEISDPRSGASNSELACLHAILHLIQQGIPESDDSDKQEEPDETTVQPPFHISHPMLSERCYEVVYRLCESTSTFGPTMRFLRTHDFFYRQLKIMSVEREDEMKSDPRVELDSSVIARLHQRSWLLKLIALELHITTMKGHRSHTSKLVDALFITPIQSAQEKEANRWDWQGGTRWKGKASSFEQPLTKMLEMLNALSFEENQGVSVDLVGTIFQHDLVNFNFFAHRNERGVNNLDIRRVHSYLIASMKDKEASGALPMTGSRDSAKAQMKAVLHQALEYNFGMELSVARQHCVEAWSETCRVALTECFNLFPSENRESKLYDLLAALLAKVNAPETFHVIAEKVSFVVVVLLAKLKEDQTKQSLLRSAAPHGGARSLNVRLPVDSLQQVVLRGILDGILLAGSSLTLRTNYYTALLNYLQYTNGDTTTQGDGDDTGAREQLLARNHALITGFNEKLFEAVARDASDVESEVRGVAFMLLDALCDVAGWGRGAGRTGKPNVVVGFLVKNNYLGGFVRNLRERDNRVLREMLHRDDEQCIRAWYMFQVKMSMLQRIALSEEGTHQLLLHNLIETLGDMDVLSERFTVGTAHIDEGNPFPPASERYEDVLVRCLSLIVSVVDGCYDVLSRVAKFINDHREIITNILQDTGPITLASLTALNLVTALFANLAAERKIMDKEFPRSSYQDLLLILLNRYSGKSWEEKLQPGTMDEVRDSQLKVHFLGRPSEETVLHQQAEAKVRQICRNLLTFCRGMTTSSEPGAGRFAPLFEFRFALPDADGARIPSAKAPTLGAMIKYASNVIDSLAQSLDDFGNVSLKIVDVQKLPVDEINEIVKSSAQTIDEVSTTHKLQLAVMELKKEVKEKKQEVMLLLYTLENALLLIWRHLELRRTSPNLLTSVPETEDAKSTANEMLTKVVQRVGASELPQQINYPGGMKCLHMLARKLLDCGIGA